MSGERFQGNTGKIEVSNEVVAATEAEQEAIIRNTNIVETNGITNPSVARILVFNHATARMRRFHAEIQTLPIEERTGYRSHVFTAEELLEDISLALKGDYMGLHFFAYGVSQEFLRASGRTDDEAERANKFTIANAYHKLAQLVMLEDTSPTDSPSESPAGSLLKKILPTE